MSEKQRIAALARQARLTPEQRELHAQKARESWYRRSPEARAAHLARMTKLEGLKPRTAKQQAQLTAAREKVSLEGRRAWGKIAVQKLYASMTPAQRRAKAKFANAMRKFKRRGYLVQVER